MASHTTTVWTCERCGDVEEVEGHDKQPKDWIRVLFVTPPRGSLSDLAEALGDLCNKCGGDLVWFCHGNDLRAHIDGLGADGTMEP